MDDLSVIHRPACLATGSACHPPPEDSPWWLTTRVGADGSAERVFTLFDASLLALRWYEATRDPAWLASGVRLLAPRRQLLGGSLCWAFSPSVPDSPPDADTTASALLVFDAAERAGIGVPAFDRADTARLFERLSAGNAGLRTYLTERRNNHTDIVVNLCVAEWLARSGAGPGTLAGIAAFASAVLAGADWGRSLSVYYPSNLFVAWRAARLARAAPGLLTDAALRSVGTLLCGPFSADVLHAALAAEACAALGFPERGRELLRELPGGGGPRGSAPWCPVYLQSTPRFAYGSGVLTEACVLAAERAVGARGGA